MNLDKHPFFEPWQDPQSGVRSYLLRERVAPIQQTFYFTTGSVSNDERWLWFYAAFPPNRQKSLGCVCLDPENPVIRHFPQAGFVPESPMVAPEGDAVYFCMHASVYRMNVEGHVEVVCTLKKDQIARRQLNRLATHLTLSADGTYFLLDGELGNCWFVGLGDVRTGEVTILKKFANHHNHAQFSPVDPELFLIPQDNWSDKITGDRFLLEHRLWLMDIRQTRFEPVCPGEWYGVNSQASHEWWSKDGMVCWNDYALGTFECDAYTLRKTHVWKRSLCHAHCDATRQYWCADQNPYKWATETVAILFYDRQRQQESRIVSAMPPPPVSPALDRFDPPYCPRDTYHLDPHPHFSPRGTWIIYSSMVREQVDVALTPVRQLVAASSA